MGDGQGGNNMNDAVAYIRPLDLHTVLSAAHEAVIEVERQDELARSG